MHIDTSYLWIRRVEKACFVWPSGPPTFTYYAVSQETCVRLVSLSFPRAYNTLCIRVPMLSSLCRQGWIKALQYTYQHTHTHIPTDILSLLYESSFFCVRVQRWLWTTESSCRRSRGRRTTSRIIPAGSNRAPGIRGTHTDTALVCLLLCYLTLTHLTARRCGPTLNHMHALIRSYIPQHSFVHLGYTCKRPYAHTRIHACVHTDKYTSWFTHISTLTIHSCNQFFVAFVNHHALHIYIHTHISIHEWFPRHTRSQEFDAVQVLPRDCPDRAGAAGAHSNHLRPGWSLWLIEKDARYLLHLHE